MSEPFTYIYFSFGNFECHVISMSSVQCHLLKCLYSLVISCIQPLRNPLTTNAPYFMQNPPSYSARVVSICKVVLSYRWLFTKYMLCPILNLRFVSVFSHVTQICFRCEKGSAYQTKAFVTGCVSCFWLLIFALLG